MINDTPKGFFSVERELRQGDPLSAFLFLVVGGALGWMIKVVVDAGLFTRFEVAGDTPAISHMQFAYYTLIFYGKDENQI